MPVLLSGGTWFQSTSETVNMLPGSFGYSFSATVLRPAVRILETSKVNRVYAPVTVVLLATWWPSTHTSAVPITPFTTSCAAPPLRGSAVKSVRYHHGAANCGIVTGPALSVVYPKHLRRLSEK